MRLLKSVRLTTRVYGTTYQIYRIARNFGEQFNLADCQAYQQIKIHQYYIMTLCTMYSAALPTKLKSAKF